jgi:energy-coupling factor transport system ATP-binding protein
MALLEIKNLSFSYQNNPVLKELNLSLKEGEFVVLTGATGSGKSTLLKLIKKELTPRGKLIGSIYFDGKDYKDFPFESSASSIGYVMQNPENQIITDKVYHELAFGLENLGLEREEIRRRVSETAAFFGIDSWFRQDTFSLSGGEKQLLVLTSILSMRPRLLLLDEPTSELDPVAAEQFLSLLKKINQELGISILIVEHRLDAVLAFADRFLIINEGKILFDGNPREISMQIDSSLPIGIPSAIKIYKGLGGKGPCPLTVKEGAEFLSRYQKQKEFSKKIISKPGKKIYELKDIWFSYGKNNQEILRGLDLDIFESEIMTLVGGNGSGKSTLLKIIAGLYKVPVGKILFNKKNIKTYKDKELYHYNLAYLPQNPQDLFMELTVKEEIGRTDENFKLIEEFELTALLDKHPYDLSGGEQQRLAFVKLLSLKPKTLLLDEPTKGLDKRWKEIVEKLLIKMKNKGITIIIVTHDLEFAARISDRCGMLFDGEVISLSDPISFFSGNTFYTTPANRISRKLYPEALTEEEVIRLAKLHGEKDENNH